ncbi:MAG: shikimate kinase [Candidatus Zixiibacteriota bacterium]
MTARPDNIFLTGFSTSGKTTLGRKLARKLKMRFYDTDRLIEKKEKQPITLIFKEKGEKYFRTQENKIIRQVVDRPGQKVVALGGGAFLNKANRELVQAYGIVVYLSCSVRELYRRLKVLKGRPLLVFDTKKYPDRATRIESVKQLLATRQSNYNKADYRISTTNKSITLSVNQIIKKIKNARIKS